MTTGNSDWLEGSQLQIIANSLSFLLRSRHGPGGPYTPRQILDACASFQIVGPSQACALALFASPAVIEEQDLLSLYHIDLPLGEFQAMITRQLGPGSSTSSHEMITTVGSPATDDGLSGSGTEGSGGGDGGSD